MLKPSRNKVRRTHLEKRVATVWKYYLEYTILLLSLKREKTSNLTRKPNKRKYQGNSKEKLKSTAYRSHGPKRKKCTSYPCPGSISQGVGIVIGIVTLEDSSVVSRQVNILFYVSVSVTQHIYCYVYLNLAKLRHIIDCICKEKETV